MVVIYLMLTAGSLSSGRRPRPVRVSRKYRRHPPVYPRHRFHLPPHQIYRSGTVPESIRILTSFCHAHCGGVLSNAEPPAVSRLLQRCLVLQHIFGLGPPRADRAAAMLRRRAAIDHRFPDMAIRTPPPNPFTASSRDHFRRQSAVERRMPLGRNARLLCRQIVEAGQHLPARAIGTARTLNAAGRSGSIGVAQRAAPPNFFLGIGKYLPHCDLIC